MINLKNQKVALALLISIIAWAVLTFSGLLSTFDTGLLQAMRYDGAPIGPDWMPAVMIYTTHLGDFKTMLAVALLLTGWLYYRGDKKAAILTLVITGGIFILVPLLKLLFGRLRPEVVDHLVHAGSASFPSGHALRSAVVFFTVGYVLQNVINFKKNIIIIISCILILIVSFSRIYLGVHWPTDIISSGLIAAFWLSLLLPLVEKALSETAKPIIKTRD